MPYKQGWQWGLVGSINGVVGHVMYLIGLSRDFISRHAVPSDGMCQMVVWHGHISFTLLLHLLTCLFEKNLWLPFSVYSITKRQSYQVVYMTQQADRLLHLIRIMPLGDVPQVLFQCKYIYFYKMSLCVLQWLSGYRSKRDHDSGVILMSLND